MKTESWHEQHVSNKSTLISDLGKAGWSCASRADGVIEAVKWVEGPQCPYPVARLEFYVLGDGEANAEQADR